MGQGWEEGYTYINTKDCSSMREKQRIKRPQGSQLLSMAAKRIPTALLGEDVIECGAG